MENHPVILLPPINNNDSKIDDSFQTATNHNGNNSSTSQTNNSRDELKISTNMDVCPSTHTKIHPRDNKSSKTTLKTIHHSTIVVSSSFETILDIKNDICAGTPFISNDLMIIQCGKELKDSMRISPQELVKQPAFIIVRSKSNSKVKVIVKSKDGALKEIEVVVSKKVFQIKKELYVNKATTCKPENQRLIVGAKVLHDTCIIGDYLLKALKSKLVSSTTKISNPSPVLMHISETFNSKHEVDISITLLSKKKINFSFEITQPIHYISDLLWKNFHLPRPDEQHSYVFMIPSPVDNEEMVELDHNKNLLDYGITPNVRKLEMKLLVNDISASIGPSPIEIFISICSTFALELVKRNLTSPDQLDSNAFNQVLQSTPISFAVPVPMPMVNPKKSSRASSDKSSKLSLSSNAINPSDNTTNNNKKRPQESSSLFQGLKKGFLGEKRLQETSANTTQTTTATIESPMFGGMKKGFLGGSKKKVTTQLKPDSTARDATSKSENSDRTNK
eukprot:gene9305-12537_t